MVSGRVKRDRVCCCCFYCTHAWRRAAQVPWAPRMLLHAAELELAHPATGQPLRVAAPLPADFLAALSKLGLHDMDADAALQQAAA